MFFYFDIVSSEVQRASMDTKKKIMDALKNRVVNIWREKLSNIFEATYNFYGKEVNFTLEELFSSLTVIKAACFNKQNVKKAKNLFFIGPIPWAKITTFFLNNTAKKIIPR